MGRSYGGQGKGIAPMGCYYRDSIPVMPRML